MSQTIDVEARGEILVLKETINDMVERLSNFCNEVQRVAKDVGVDGKMGAQADVAGLKGRWKEITTDVNTMASNLVSPLNGCAGALVHCRNSELLIIIRRRKSGPSPTSPTWLPTATSRNLLTWRHLERWTS